MYEMEESMVGGSSKKAPKKDAGKSVGGPLYRGQAFQDLVEGLRYRIESDSRRIMARNRRVSIRMEAYVDAQPNAAVREAVMKLVGARKWRYVSFVEFSEALARLGEHLFKSLSHGEEICFAVDSVQNGIKSSFWVVVMVMLMARPSSAVYAGLSLAVDDDGAGGGLYTAFRQLDPATRIVLTDDATYSGEQLSYFHESVVEAWQNAHNTRKKPHTTLAVPFMSLHSASLLKSLGGRSTRILNIELFPSLFHKRTLASTLSSDLYLEYKSPLVTEYHSLYFDFLSVLPTNSLFLFEHKVADALSIPDRWLKAGPCIPQWVRSAQRVRPDRAADLVRLLRQELGAPSPGPGTGGERAMLAASRRVCELLSSSQRFRVEFFERTSLAPDADRRGGPPAPSFSPLISPEFCDSNYRRYVRTHLGLIGSGSPRLFTEEMPPCRRPPYKRGSFREAFLSKNRLRHRRSLF